MNEFSGQIREQHKLGTLGWNGDAYSAPSLWNMFLGEKINWMVFIDNLSAH